MSQTQREHLHGLQVAPVLATFIDTEVLPGTGLTADAFWAGFSAIVQDLAPRNGALLVERDRLQTELDSWHAAHPGPVTDMPAYQAFLRKIGYLVESPRKVRCTTRNVDDELARQAGPQLVVPILNARYALNAANARWGSLYDALYGTDVISEEKGCEKVGPKGYNPKRGAKVIEYARHVLDRCAPLAKASHLDAAGYAIVDGALQASRYEAAIVAVCAKLMDEYRQRCGRFALPIPRSKKRMDSGGATSHNRVETRVYPNRSGRDSIRIKCFAEASP